MTDEIKAQEPLLFGVGEDRRSLNEVIAVFDGYAKLCGLPLVDVLAAYVAASDCWFTEMLDFAAPQARQQVAQAHVEILVNIGAEPEKLGLVEVTEEGRPAEGNGSFDVV